MSEGMADIIGMARALIVDPDFPNKAKGLREEIIPCMVAIPASQVIYTTRVFPVLPTLKSVGNGCFSVSSSFGLS